MMDKMLDGNSAAELARDKGEIPRSILAQARRGLYNEARETITFPVMLEALEQADNSDAALLEKYFKEDADIFRIGARFQNIVDDYIAPTEEEVSLRAAEILAEIDDRKGVTI